MDKRLVFFSLSLAIFVLLFIGANAVYGSDSSTPTSSPSPSASPTSSPSPSPSPEVKTSYKAILKFSYPLSLNERAEYEVKGIKLLQYIGDNSWITKINYGVSLASFNKIIEKKDISSWKRASELFLQKTESLMKSNSLEKIPVLIEYFEETDLNEIENFIINSNGKVTGKSKYFNLISAEADAETINSLKALESVYYIEEILPAIPLNDNARASSGVEVVQNPPYNLDGVGIKIAMFEACDPPCEGADLTNSVFPNHADFNNRLVIKSGLKEGAHATMVAGVFAGDGSLSLSQGGYDKQWRGMAPSADISSNSPPGYGTFNKIIEEILSGAKVEHNSWGLVNQTGSSCLTNLGYLSEEAKYDNITRDYNVSIVFAAGNDGKGCIAKPAIAKNVVSVGALNPDDSIASLSSGGPTNDGRIKPDVVALGCGIKSTRPGDIYNPAGCGTSLSSPIVSGSIALLLQKYRGIHGQEANYKDPFPSTIKALLIHTAKDLGNIGPDFDYGWGKINITTAVDLIRDDETKDLIIKDSLDYQGGYDLYTINASSGKEIKLTLAWSDFPGSPGAEKALVNDLDIELILPSGKVYLPWVLDPSNPSAPASNGVDRLNNIEQVIVENIPANEVGEWKIKVYAYSLPEPAQSYSLISSHDLTLAGKFRPHLESSIVTPDIAVKKGEFFDFSVGVRCIDGDCGDVSAWLDPAAITCDSSPCVAGSELIRSRDNIDIPEPNAPNTIDGCGDFNEWSYDLGSHIENMTISNLEEPFFGTGDLVEVKATVRSSHDSTTKFNMVYANNIEDPNWEIIETIMPEFIGSGFYNIKSYLRLDNILGTHNIRVNSESKSYSPVPCTSGQNGDNDDISIIVKKGKGILTNNSLDEPFYTTSDQPQKCLNMKDGDECILKWQVKGTGVLGTYKFFAIVNSTKSIPGNESEKTDVTLFDNKFIRADANQDNNTVDISDAVATLRYLFANKEVKCLDAVDSNDDGSLNVADAVYTLSYLFAGGTKPPMPSPAPGIDPTADSLTCSGVLESGMKQDALKAINEIEANKTMNPQVKKSLLDSLYSIEGLVLYINETKTFNGKNYILINDSSKLNITEYTIQFSFKANNPKSKTQSLIARGEDWVKDKAQWIVQLNNANALGKMQLWYEETNDADHYFSSKSSITAGKWYDFKTTRDINGTVKIYLNGTLEYTRKDIQKPAKVATPVLIGARRNAPNIVQDYFNGTMRDIRVYDRVV